MSRRLAHIRHLSWSRRALGGPRCMRRSPGMCPGCLMRCLSPGPTVAAPSAALGGGWVPSGRDGEGFLWVLRLIPGPISPSFGPFLCRLWHRALQRPTLARSPWFARCRSRHRAVWPRPAQRWRAPRCGPTARDRRAGARSAPLVRAIPPRTLRSTGVIGNVSDAVKTMRNLRHGWTSAADVASRHPAQACQESRSGTVQRRLGSEVAAFRAGLRSASRVDGSDGSGHVGKPPAVPHCSRSR